MDVQKLLEKSVLGRSIFDYSAGKPDESAVHIGFGVDDSYVRCMGTAIASICENNKEQYLVFHVLAGVLQEESLAGIKQLAADFSVKINIYFIDQLAFTGLPTQVHFPASIYYRYILPVILDIPRVLYLDADIVCLGSLQTLWQTDLQKDVVGAVPDVAWLGQKRNKALSLQNHIYFNSGVLLIDIAQWNEIAALDKVLKLLSETPEKFRYPDQDALNVVLTGRVCYLADKWNHLNTVIAAQQGSILLHFAAHPKPWNIAWPLSKICNEFTKDIYMRYELLTPWKNCPLLLPRNYKEMKVYAMCLLKQGNYVQGFKWYARYVQTKLIGD